MGEQRKGKREREREKKEERSANKLLSREGRGIKAIHRNIL